MSTQDHRSLDDPSGLLFRLIPLLDGTRDRAALGEHLMRLFEDGGLIVQEGHTSAMPGKDPEEFIRENMDALLQHVARAGLLVA